MKTDVIIIGGGIAGLSAALHCVELGLHPLILEKGNDDAYPCNSRFASGLFHVAYRDVKSPTPDLTRRIREVTAGYVSTVLADLISGNSGRAVDWLKEHGARFIKAGPEEWQGWVLAPPANKRIGLHWQGRGADITLRRLTEKIVNRGGTLEKGATVRELVTTGGQVTGVSYVSSSGLQTTATATAVVIADGGFQADQEMLRQYITESPDRVMIRGARSGTGDGIKMALAVGAALTDMRPFYGHLLARDVFEDEKFWPYPYLDNIAQAGLLVDSDGKRIADEGLGGVYLSNMVVRSDDPAGVVVVFDHDVWNGPAKMGVIAPNPHLVLSGGTIHQADTLEKLAIILNIPSHAMANTVESYNEAVSLGDTEKLHPPRTVDSYRAWPLKTPPYYAIPACVGITHTMGGVLVDDKMRVLNKDNQPIKGLYAAGATAGGFEGGPTAGYVGGLIKGVVHGLLAAEHISSNLV